MESRQQSVANVTQVSPEAPYYVKGLVLGLSAYLIGIHLWTWVLTVSVFLGGRSDFRQLYTAGYMFRTGHSHELYEYNAQRHFQNQLVSPGDIALPFNHLAYEALLFVPFSLLSYRTAYFTLLGLNVTVLAITFKFLRPWMKNLAVIYRWLPPVMFLAFLPIAAALLQGQDSILLLTLLAAALVSLISGWRSCRAGIVQVSDRDSNRTVVLDLAPMAVRLRFREFGPSRDSGINLACRHFSIHYIRPLVNYNGSRPT